MLMFLLYLRRLSVNISVNVRIERPNIARSTGLFKLRQSAETCEVRVFTCCRLLTPTLRRDVIYEPRTRWLRARTEEVICWLQKSTFRGGKTWERGREIGGHNL